MEMEKYILSLSYGKDSLACLGAIAELGWPIDGILTADVWATDTIPADLPPMVQFKAEADAIILEKYGIEVKHVRAKKTYEQQFYTTFKSGKRTGEIYGWPTLKAPWCNSMLKTQVLDRNKKGEVTYIGIAADEPGRFHSLNAKRKSPLVESGWTEEKCREWCEKRNLLSPIYDGRARGGCWFCHNQSVEQLRLLRRDYPEYWSLMLKWDADSKVTFKKDGRTVHDYDKRFQMEEDGIINKGDKFLWSMLDGPIQMKFL